MGKRTVAEFVENAGTLELLREYGVDYAPGFYISRPAPLYSTLAMIPEETRLFGPTAGLPAVTPPVTSPPAAGPPRDPARPVTSARAFAERG